MEEGVNDWKNAHSKFCWHEKSSIHIEAVSKLLENRNEKDIVELFGQEDLKQKQESFRCLLKTFSVLRVLTRQGEALRGHAEEESNFFQHLKCLAEGNEELTAWIGKKTFRFISPKIQNEIVQTMALDILEKVTENVRKANFFSILLDKSRDVSNLGFPRDGTSRGMSRDKPGRDVPLSLCPGTKGRSKCHGTNISVPARPTTKQFKNFQKKSQIYCFRTSFSCFRTSFPF